MKSQIIAIAAVVAFAAGISVVSAAENQASSDKAMSNTAMSNKTASPAMSKSSMAQDTLTLTPAQEKIAWRDIGREASNQLGPLHFTPAVGTKVPSDITLKSVPSQAAARVSALKPYDYALVQHKLVIANPVDKKIVDVITKRA